MPDDVRFELAQDQHGEGGRADAVGVVVAVNADSLAGGNGAFDRVHARSHVPEQERVVAREGSFEERARLVGVVVAAPNEHSRGRLAEPERLRERARGVVRARLDRPVHGPSHGTEAVGRRNRPVSILGNVTVEANYSSGEDYMVEFLGYRFAFNAEDFEQRVTAAAVKLGLVEDNDLDEDEMDDLVELAADGMIDEPRSSLGRYLVRHWEQLSLIRGESLVYWLRKLVFRGAWLDHRVKEGLLEVDWDDDEGEFAYRDPRGDRALLELAPIPSWHEVQFRR